MQVKHAMRRKDREITDPIEIDAILERADYGHLGLCDGDEPYVLPMNFGLADGAVYLHCASEGRKLDILRRNPNACFQVETGTQLLPSPNACSWGIAFQSVMIFGTISVVESEEEKVEGLAALMKQCAGDGVPPVFPPESVASVTVLRLDPSGRTAKVRPSA